MIKEFILDQVSKQKKLYVKLSIVFFVGLFLGVFCINNIEIQLIEKLKLYFNNFGDAVEKIENAQIASLFINSFFSKFKFIGLIFILACTIIGSGLIYMLILYKGFSLGYVISAILRVYGLKKGIVFAMSTMLVQNIIYIPCIIFFAVYSINFSKMIKNTRVNIKALLLKYFIVFIIVLLISTIASTAELLVSYNVLKKIQIFY
ncbi:MAG: stage II sporulation protein M [Clostridia bacterium]|nr:stage II sporulation protein M [Clostridia bacterium]